MSNELKPKPDPGLVYQIRIAGHVSRDWADWFGGLTITLEENGETLLTCPMADQSALYGLLRKVRDSGLSLISVNRLMPGPTTRTGADQTTIVQTKENKT
jgi:hypothetical protein